MCAFVCVCERLMLYVCQFRCVYWHTCVCASVYVCELMCVGVWGRLMIQSERLSTELLREKELDPHNF